MTGPEAQDRRSELGGIDGRNKVLAHFRDLVISPNGDDVGVEVEPPEFIEQGAPQEVAHVTVEERRLGVESGPPRVPRFPKSFKGSSLKGYFLLLN